MSYQTLTSPAPAAVHRFANGRLRTLMLLAFLLAVLALIAPHRLIVLGLISASATLCALALWLSHLNRLDARKTFSKIDGIADLIAQDIAPSFVTLADGQITARNIAAERHFENTDRSTLAAVLEDSFANPRGILFHLQKRVQTSGAAQEDISTRNGHIRLSVHQLDEETFVWRVQQIPYKHVTNAPTEGHNLPMIITGRNDTVLFMNNTARALIGARRKSLDQIFLSLPPRPGEVMELSTTDGPHNALIAKVDAGIGRKAIYLLPPPEVPDQDPCWRTFHHLPVPLIKVAPDGAVLSFNKMAISLIGKQLIKDTHLSDLMEGLGRSINDWLNDTLTDRKGQKSEFLRLTRSDREVFVQVTLNRVTEEGETTLIAVLHDATELKSLEAQFVQSQKMQAIGQLAGGVAHDFNNLLTAISGHCDLLLLRHDQGDPDYGDLVQINQNANRAASLVGQLLAFSRKQTLRPETLDMRDTLADLTHLLNRLVGEKITLTLSHDPVLKPIRADKRQLEQVLMNLVVNARDAMPAGGEIKILTECASLTEPLTRDRVSVPPGQYVTVTVSDDGTGIPPDKLQKVFEPFFTTKRTGEGTGLGLSTAYGIIKQSGGFIFVDSTVGSGTAFTLYFPVMDVLEPTKTLAPNAPKQTGTKHEDGVILLVEDEAPVRAFASRALRLRGYTVLEADSAEAALKTLEDRALDIDVFVTDVVMPGMDGPSWVRQALKDRPGVRVVFVSGYAEDSFEEVQTRIPNSVFLPKPFSLNDLTDTVHNQLH